MALETELKLRIAPEHLNGLKRHSLLKTLSAARATTRKLYSIYYDTPDLDLHQGAMALRLRRAGRQWLQTMKGGGGVQAGLHQRNEWEAPVNGEALDFDVLQACGGVHLPRAVRKKLQAVFVTEFSRTSRMLDFEGAQIELSLDSGEIRAGQAIRPISELELELKSGQPLQLFRLALRLLDIVPLEIESASKAEYGYRLFANTQTRVVTALKSDLAQEQEIPAALQSMIWSCLFHLQANVPGAVESLDDEYLHQVRVALRRMRVALGIVKTFRADGELLALSNELAALGIELGRSREWDVFCTQTLSPVCARLPEHAGLRQLSAASAQLREQHHGQVRNALQGQNFQRLLLRFGAWMNGDYWNEASADVATSLPQFAEKILQRRSKQVHKLGKKIDQPAAASQLHQLRIACKKLRYSAELLAPLFAQGRARRYVATLSELQDILGALHDIAVADGFLDELDTQVAHETTALVRGWIAHDYTQLLARFDTAWLHFSRRKAFWV